MSKRNQLDLNCITDLVAVISQLSSYISSTFIDFSLSFNCTILQFLPYNIMLNIMNFRIFYIHF